MGWVSVVGSQNYKTCDVDNINIFLNFNNLVQRWEVGGWLNPEPDEFRYLMHFYLFTFTFFCNTKSIKTNDFNEKDSTHHYLINGINTDDFDEVLRMTLKRSYEPQWLQHQ